MKRWIELGALCLLAFAVTPRVQAQQDPQQLMQQITDLMQQMQGASDPCPYMAKFKALISQIASQSPDVYNAMKPSLDLMNQDNTCADTSNGSGGTNGGGTTSDPSNHGPDQSSGTPSSAQQQQDAQRLQNIQRLQAAKLRAQQSTGQSQTSGGTSQHGSTPNVSCNDVTRSVQLTVTTPKSYSNCQGEVVGVFKNGADDTVTCTTAFHHNGEWDDYGMGYVKAGATEGGEMGGFWSCGTDKPEIRYVCFLGTDPVDAKGNSCNANIHW